MRVSPGSPTLAHSANGSQHTLSDLPPQWGQPEELAPFSRAFKYAVLTNKLGAAGVPMVELDSGGSAYDVHAFFGHLLPGARYNVHFLLKRTLGTQQMRLAALTGEGQVLEVVPVDVRGGALRPAQFSFSLPRTSSSAVIYVYTGESGSGTRTLISEPQIAMIDAAGVPVAFHQAPAISTPDSVTVRQLDAANYAIHVRDAPPRFLIAMLATSDPQWRITTPAGVATRRVTVNFYCSSWIISGPRGSYTLKLSYGDPRWSAATLGATVAALAAVVLLAIPLVRTW